MPVTMTRLNMAAGLGPVLQIAEGTTVDLPKEVAAPAGAADQPHVAHHVVRSPRDGRRGIPRRVLRDEQLGRQSRRHQLRAHRCGPHRPCLDPPHPGFHAQRAGRESVSTEALGVLRRRGVRVRRLTAPAPPSAPCTGSRGGGADGRGHGTSAEDPVDRRVADHAAGASPEHPRRGAASSRWASRTAGTCRSGSCSWPWRGFSATMRGSSAPW